MTGWRGVARHWCLFGLALFADPTELTAHKGAATTRPLRIVVLGDSLAVSPSRTAGFPALLQGRLAEEGLASWTVINAGVHGDTTAGGLRRLDYVLAGESAILIVALGANDGLRGVPIATVKQNLATIIERAQSRGMQVLLCGMETPPLRGWNYTLDFHNIFPQLAREHDVPLVPFLLTGVVGVRELNGDDLIHPNGKGATRIAETIWPQLERLIRRDTSASYDKTRS